MHNEGPPRKSKMVKMKLLKIRINRERLKEDLCESLNP
jgi:hypothetical protein